MRGSAHTSLRSHMNEERMTYTIKRFTFTVPGYPQRTAKNIKKYAEKVSNVLNDDGASFSCIGCLLNNNAPVFIILQDILI